MATRNRKTYSSQMHPGDAICLGKEFLLPSKQMGVEPKIWENPPNHHMFNRVFHYKPSILGYHYFWKHPFWKHPNMVGWLCYMAGSLCHVCFDDLSARCLGWIIFAMCLGSTLAQCMAMASLPEGTCRYPSHFRDGLSPQKIAKTI